MQIEQVKLCFTPVIEFTAEQAARYLDISLEKANELLSAPDTKDIVQCALMKDIQESLNRVMIQMKRSRWPSVMDREPIRQDCVVELPSLPAMTGIFGK